MVYMSDLKMFYDSQGVVLVGSFSGFPSAVKQVRAAWSFAPESEMWVSRKPDVVDSTADHREIGFTIDGFPTARHIFLFLRDAETELNLWADDFLLMADGPVKGIESNPKSGFQCGHVPAQPRL